MDHLPRVRICFLLMALLSELWATASFAAKGDFAFVGATRWVVIASRESKVDAIELAGQFKESKVMESENGWYAVVLGPYDDLTTIADYTASKIPEDAYLAKGDNFVDMVWVSATTPKKTSATNGSQQLTQTGENRWLIIAARESVPDAISLAKQYFSATPRVIESENGSYAVALGPVRVGSDVSDVASTYSEQLGITLPSDSYLATGKNFKKVVWTAAKPRDVKPAVAVTVTTTPSASAQTSTLIDLPKFAFESHSPTEEMYDACARAYGALSSNEKLKMGSMFAVLYPAKTNKENFRGICYYFPLKFTFKETWRSVQDECKTKGGTLCLQFADLAQNRIFDWAVKERDRVTSGSRLLARREVPGLLQQATVRSLTFAEQYYDLCAKTWNDNSLGSKKSNLVLLAFTRSNGTPNCAYSYVKKSYKTAYDQAFSFCKKTGAKDCFTFYDERSGKLSNWATEQLARVQNGQRNQAYAKYELDRKPKTYQQPKVIVTRKQLPSQTRRPSGGEFLGSLIELGGAFASGYNAGTQIRNAYTNSGQGGNSSYTLPTAGNGSSQRGAFENCAAVYHGIDANLEQECINRANSMGSIQER
ncbi:MAG: hypothetical protein ABI705_09030 [Aestuariivirga sp.]